MTFGRLVWAFPIQQRICSYSLYPPSGEGLWRRVLSDRYESVWRRCAPRGRFRTRELADLMARNDAVAGALQRRLARWLAEGAQVERLPAEVEAAFVQSRTPDRLA